MVANGIRAGSPSPSIADKRFFASTPTKVSRLRALQRQSSPGRASHLLSRQSPLRSRRSFSNEERRDDSPEADNENVCDYDSSATVLYELLESSSWDRARARCRSHPEEVRTWIVRKDKSLAVRWKLLPLHAAIIFQSPNYLVSALMDQYSAATHRADDQDMLPLHLAFRHKHEDEDLLELLLVKYPKAVLLKDKRGRVPLEHAREGKFSAKLMRLYADAVTVASRVVGKTSQPSMTPTSNLTAGERELLVKDHQDELQAVKHKYESQIRKLKSQSSEQVHDIEDNNEQRLELVRSEYEMQIRKLKDHYERRMEDLVATNEHNLRSADRNLSEANKEAERRHTEELKKLRSRLNQQLEQDRELTDSLEKEIAHLQIALQECKSDQKSTQLQNAKLKASNKDLFDTISEVQKQQQKIQELVAQQHEDFEMAKNIRSELVQTLLKLDSEKKSHSSHMLEAVDKLNRKVEKVLDKSAVFHKRSDRIHRKPSRDRNLPREERPKNRLERAREDEYDRRSKLSRNREGFDEDYGEVRIIADEISAITTNTDF